MTTWIALLRGINVGGHKRVAMADVRSLLADLGYRNPRTVLQSGNAVFDSAVRSAERLERRLETEVAGRLGIECGFFVRDAREWRGVIARNPFPDAAASDPSHLLVYFLRSSPSRKQVDALRTAMTGPERARVVARQAYLVYPEGLGRSRLSPTVVERALGRGTGRNWNTVLKLAALTE